MRIALVIERMDLSRGGRETSTAQIAEALAARGHEVGIICQSGSWERAGVEILELGRRGLLRVQQLRNFIADAAEEISGRRYDVVHAMLPVPAADVYQPRGGTVPGQRQAGRRRRSASASLAAKLAEGLNLWRREMAELERRVVADQKVLCLAVSEMVAREFADHYGRTDRVRTIYNAVDVPDPAGDQWPDRRQQLRSRMDLGPDDPVFLTIARNFRLKAVDQAIIAFAEWFHSHDGRVNGRPLGPPGGLVVVGRDTVESYQRCAGLRDVGRQVVFVPYTEEVFQWYSAADVCILLSWYDPCSRVVLEATRWGIPSITTVYNGAAEILSGGAGIVVSSPKDTRAIVRAMDALADRERRRACTEACLKVADTLSMDRHVDELLSAYREVAARK